MDDVPLSGGNITGAVRVGDTVRRTAGPWTPAVHDLLRHLRSRGIDWLPEPLGLDEHGREVLRFLPGTVPAYPLPDSVWHEDVLTAAGRMLRAAHDASLDFPIAGRTWQQPAHPPVEVVCLNDFAPHNLVFTGVRLTGAIDVDMASPGSRAWDLAHLAHRLVPLTAPDDPEAPATGVAVRARRLALLSDAYGGVGPDAVVAAVPERLRDLARFSEDRAATPSGPPAPVLAGPVRPPAEGRTRPPADFAAHAARYRRDADWVEGNAAALSGRSR